MLSLFFFVKYVFSKRANSLVRVLLQVCLVSVSIGVAALVVSLSVLNGFSYNLQKKLLSTEPHIVLNFETEPEVLTSDSLFRQKFIKDLKKYSLFLKFNSFKTQDVLLRTSDGLFSGAIAKGISRESLAFEEGNTQISSEIEVEIDFDLAQSLNVYEGDELMILPSQVLLLPVGSWPPFQTVRISSVSSMEASYEENKTFYYDLRKNKNLFSTQSSLKKGLEIFLQDPYRYKEAEEVIFKDLKFYGFQESDFRIESWTQRNSLLFMALKLEKYVMSLFLGLSVLITSFSIVTLILLLTTQKRRDMAILIAMGLSVKKVKNIFVQVGLFVFSLALLGGLLGGVLLAYFMEIYPLEILPDIYYDRTLPSRLTWQLVLGASLFCMGVGIVTTWVPVSFNMKKMMAQAFRTRNF